MLRHISGTPCPMPPYRSNADNSILSLVDGDGDTTANIEFTSAFGGLKNTKPRRMRNAASVRRATQNVDFSIHEDPESIQKKSVELKREPARRKSTIGLSQPPQRPKIAARVSFAPSVSVQSHESARPSSRPSGVVELHQAPRRHGADHATGNHDMSLLPSLPEDTTANINMDLRSPTILKPARRGTIYIPNDDTTMPSMYMGIFSPIKNLNVDAHPKPADTHAELEVTGIAAQMARKRAAPRRSMIALSPKRGGPLRVSSRYVQESAVVEDRIGQGGGKENVPPGYVESGLLAGAKVDKAKTQTMGYPPTRTTIKHDLKPAASRLHEQTASSMSRAVEKQPGRTVGTAGSKRSWNSGARVRTSQPVPVKKPSPSPAVELQEKVVPTKPTVPTRFVAPVIKAEPILDSYPVLTEDLASPSMYEDNWLNHQEIAITQLVNNLYASSSSLTSRPVEDGMLRVQLLELYNNSETSMLFKRLQGALLYGALAVPNDILKGAIRLGTDLGRRKAFADLWLETYELNSLRAVLEVVVGRQCNTTSARVSATRRSLDKEKDLSRQTVQRFIETFLIRNEDRNPDEASSKPHDSAWSYQRTLLRSLMVIRLLDHIKTASPPLTSSCLFRTTSPHKSSVDVVKALFQQLNPSAGDPIRSLSHVGYGVSHSQYPLEEYGYKIENLAIDLRDGVRLTRLVELLLYPSASHGLDHARDFDSTTTTTTVLLPSGETLMLFEGQNDWPLSQHLKFPCLGRATKLYNVQIALSALQGVKGIAPLVRDVRAEDIVDGFREKTVKLLWGLTSKWGLCGLLDWHDLEREVKRLRRLSLGRAGGAGDDDEDILDAIEDEDENDPVRYKMLLKAWAKAVARKHGLVVKNLTTSFADGRVFEAIVDEYEGACQVATTKETSDKADPTILGLRLSLAERLRRLGCSDQFSSLFSAGSSGTTHIFDRGFVLAALAFLCSRLLTPSKRVRAAVTIQRAWRARWAKVIEERKARLKSIAEQCAEVVVSQKSEDVPLQWDDIRDGQSVMRSDETSHPMTTVVAETSVEEARRAEATRIQKSGDEQDDDEDIWLNL
ncbi:hypothetical protein PV08_07420 [Exophiala spinifera]|uniref:Calponin-homology (CH) domain-containing protein n=1 Tax=Exophiala spinifera TaxID=91928 RepID=A0A0D1YI71_9EURO|nr:uncharacterized protein PV08_07420 [Exophiala spinifera]KIW14636.1 hypothetical protein PV08_07420 [Exophiala spinifera]